MREYNAAKRDCGRGSVPDPAGGAYSAPPDLLAGFKGARQGGEGNGGKGREGRGRKREERGREGREGREGEVDSGVQLERLFYESALIDPENAFRNITKTHFET